MKAFWVSVIVIVLAAAGYVTFSNTRAMAKAEKEAAGARAAEAAAKQNAEQQSSKQQSEKKQGTESPAATTPPAASATTPKAQPAADAKKLARPPAESVFPSDEIAMKLSPVVVVARSFKPDGSPLAQTMGFLIASDLAVVGREVLKDSAAVKLGLVTGETVETVGFVGDDQTRGFAILKLASPVKTQLAAKIATTPVKADEPVGIVGPLTPDGLRVAAVYAGPSLDVKFGAMVAFGEPVLGTPSGCAVVNAVGDIVAMVTGESTSVPSAERAVAAASIGGLPRFAVMPYTLASAAGGAAKGPVEAKAEVDTEAKLEKQADSSTLVDGKYTLKGEGTAASPYEVTWEMLVSAQQSYDPKKGQKKIPGRVAMLDGKHVRINGWIAFPLYVEQPKELLSMLNQWDGCCIGTPPTPYDAIEVRLGTTVAKDDRLTTFGAVEGTFGVKPYLVGDWLVGLFVMDNAKLIAKQLGGFGS